MSHIFCQQVQLDELEAIKIEHPLFSATLLLQGAQLIEFTPTSTENNLLWLSDSVEYKQGKPLRGGIPICWPWFGNLDKNPPAIQSQIKDKSSASAHGFARSMPWKIVSIIESCHQVEVILALTSDEQTKALWPFEFNLEARFIFSQQLEIELKTVNNSETAFSFSQALHTYLPTADINKTYIHNTHNSYYIDAMDHWQEKPQIGRIGFSEETDRLYFFPEQSGSNQFQLRVEAPNQQLLVNTENSRSAVIWNPWVKKSLGLSQFSPHDYQNMLCIESANILDDSVLLESQQQHSLKLTLTSLGNFNN